MKKLFIHIPKNGGMTIRHSSKLKKRIIIVKKDKLISSSYLQGLKRHMKSLKDHNGIEHARWRDVHPDWRKFDAFCLIRNPWSKVSSRYQWAKACIQSGASPKGYADVSSLEAFLEERHKYGKMDYMWHRAIRGWYPQLDHITDDKGNVQVDCLRTERLDDEIRMYFKIPEMTGPRNVTVGKVPYAEIYNKKTIQIVADWYQRDIDYFGFDFDTPAQKNYWAKENVK